MARDRKKSKKNKYIGKYEKMLEKQNSFNKRDLTPYIATLHIKNGGKLDDYIIL